MSITPTSFAVPASFASKPIIGVAAAADSVGRSPPRIAVAQPTGSGVAASFASKMTIGVAVAADDLPRALGR